MQRFFDRLLGLSAGQLLALNVALLVALKAFIPLTDRGLATIAAPGVTVDADAIVRETNAARAGAALAPLTRNAVLDDAARQKLDDMVARGYFAHRSPAGVQPWDWVTREGYVWRAAGENLARGFASAEAVVDAWMQSTAHRANVLNGAYRDIGVAAGRVTIAGKTSTVIVQLFASPRPPIGRPPSLSRASDRAQRVTTDVGVAPVTHSVEVAVPFRAGMASITEAVSGAFTVWVSVLLALLTAGILWTGHGRRFWLVIGAHALLLALATLLPPLSAARGLIF